MFWIYISLFYSWRPQRFTVLDSPTHTHTHTHSYSASRQHSLYEKGQCGVQYLAQGNFGIRHKNKSQRIYPTIRGNIWICCLYTTNHKALNISEVKMVYCKVSFGNPIHLTNVRSWLKVKLLLMKTSSVQTEIWFSRRKCAFSSHKSNCLRHSMSSLHIFPHKVCCYGGQDAGRVKTRSWEMTHPVFMWQWHMSKHGAQGGTMRGFVVS